MKQCINGRLQLPGDKSISHRALIFAVLSEGISTVSGLSPAQDCQMSAQCLRKLGLKIESTNGNNGQSISIESVGLTKLQAPTSIMDAGNSGTTIRLLSGLISGKDFEATLDGDQSLRQRPMSRILDPLTKMGAQIKYLGASGYAPFSLRGGQLEATNYQSEIASAQVQTAILLAGLQAEGETTVSTPNTARDHTRRMFQHLNVPFQYHHPGLITVKRLQSPIAPYHIDVPADISSAAFFLVAAALLPKSAILLPNVGMNPGRTLIIDTLKAMGADISIGNEHELSGEPVAEIYSCFSGRLTGATIDGTTIASGIDEIPILALAGALCQGVFSVRGAGELKVKESNRLQAIVSNLRAAGAQIVELPDGFEIEGKQSLPGDSEWLTYGDHRLAMTGLIASLVCDKPVKLDDLTCISVSYPNFQADLASILKSS